MNIYKFVLILACTLLAGCSSIVAKYIEEAGSIPYSDIVSSSLAGLPEFEKKQFCSELQTELCISYLSGKPLDNKKLRYALDLESSSGASYVELNLENKELEKNYSGLVVLLHGYRVSKEYMLTSALYFRFLGFDVLVPDLAGHGESSGSKQYGVGDSKVINELITSVYKGDKPLYLLGNSMGAAAAVYTASMRKDVTGAILQAPMLPLDQAAIRFFSVKYPSLTWLLPKDSVREGAVMALEKANVTLEETRLEPVIQSLDVPVLIFASSADDISPYSHFGHLDSKEIEVIEVKDRNHPSMMVIGDSESAQLIEWLNRPDVIAVENSNNKHAEG
ncbi:alpha/beta hydrolase [Endozoicomonas arenosclerae]|uniref:alpha/beta hydrolase n=1 Tax=Endozoicomonas arenosclerae TaxID=1633495 RepID=UPI000781BA32|nr:alpha/beta hydrolase [Endozoicomonas arenosclerae]